MATKIKPITVKGRIILCELKSGPSFDSGRYGRESYDYQLAIRLAGDDGNEYAFKTTPATYTANTSGPYTIAILHQNDWFKSKDWSCEGFAGARGFGDSPVQRVHVGDQIEVRGSVKSSTCGGKFVTLWRVKRLDYSFDAIKKAFSDRLSLARAKVPTSVDPKDVRGPITYDTTPDAIPGIKWNRIGGYDAYNFDPTAIIRYESEVTDKLALIAWSENVARSTVIDPGH